MSELSAIKDLVGDKKEDSEIGDMVERTLSQLLGREVKSTKSKTILHPSDMWKDEEEN